MPYRASGRVQDMLSVPAVERSVRQAAEDGLTFAHEAIVDRTPVAPPFKTDPQTGYLMGRWRQPGTLKRSIRKTRFVRQVTGFAVRWEAGVETDDPVGPHVEWDTKPHEIRPRRDRADASVVETGEARGGGTSGKAPALAWRGPMGGMIFAGRVDHPGTKGQHMFALGAVATERSVGSWSRRALQTLRATATKGEGRA